MSSSKKFKIVSLGCRTNQYEAEGWRKQLESSGYTEGEDADVCVVNTCTVTESADKESRQIVKRLARQNPKAKIYVSGCAADGDVEGFGRLPQVANVARNKDKEKLLPGDYPEFSIERFEGHTRAFVKVQDGCNSFCSYCIIPYVRGRSRSRGVDEILKEVEALVSNGYKEVVLTGINIGDFDGSGKTLAELTTMVDQIPGIERIRISSIDPDEVDDALLRAVIEGKHTCHSMHIVLQSGSNIVLKRMNRKYTRQMFYETIDRLKNASPDFTFTTDIIVGFPGETEIDHRETLEVMERVKFAKVHMFPYSKRERTKAALFPDPVSPDIIKRRKNEVLRLNEKLAFQLREQYVGRTMTVLTENENTGHTDNFLPVKLHQNYPSNELVTVELKKNTPEGLCS